jgi:hypothetical protein
LSGILAGAGGGSSSSLASPTWQSKRYPQKSGSLGSSGGGSEELAGCNAIGAESDMLGIWFWAWVWNGAASEVRSEGVWSGGRVGEDPVWGGGILPSLRWLARVEDDGCREGCGGTQKVPCQGSE